MRRRDEAKAAYEVAARALSVRRSRAETIQRLLAGLPHLATLGDAEARLAPLAGLPAPPDGWREMLAELQAEAIRLTAQKENAETAIRALEEELRLIGEDAAALQLAGRVDGWRELRSRYDSAKDIPVRQGELEGRRDAVDAILSRLGRAGEAESQKLLLPVRTVGALEDLIAERSGVLTKLEGARGVLDEARRAEAQALDAAPQSEDRSAAIELLKTRLQPARRDESFSRLRALRDEMERQARKLADALAALAPWRGFPEELALVSVPGETEISALRQRLSQTIAARQSHVDRLAGKTVEAERLRAETAAAARATELVGDDVAADLRAAREAKWSAHRASLSATSAAVFEAAMRSDDAAGAVRLANARELAGQRVRAVKLAGVEAECARARADLDAAERGLHGLDHQIAALMPAAVPKGREPLSFLDAWRTRREEAMAIIAALRDAKEAARRANDGALRVCRALSDALKGVGFSHVADVRARSADLESAEQAAISARSMKVESLRQEGEGPPGPTSFAPKAS